MTPHDQAIVQLVQDRMHGVPKKNHDINNKRIAIYNIACTYLKDKYHVAIDIEVDSPGLTWFTVLISKGSDNARLQGVVLQFWHNETLVQVERDIKIFIQEYDYLSDAR